MNSKDLNFCDWIETVNKYIIEYGVDYSVEVIDLDSIKKDIALLDKVTDFVIALICKIGVDDNFQPNIHGIILDGCLEEMNQLRDFLINQKEK